MSSATRIWRDIPGIKSLYEVSDDGIVRKKAYELTPYALKKGGHMHVTVGEKNRQYVHRLVARAFLPLVEGKPWVNHKDGNPANNHVTNLEWCTPGENIAHGYRSNGRINYNERTIEGTDCTSGEILKFRSITKAAAHFEVTKGAIKSAADRKGTCKKHTWAFV
jgi:hypothetical protein